MGKYGYIRVSTKEQNIDRQLIALEPLGIKSKDLFVDMQSGKDFKRPAYKRLLRKLASGDILYVKSIDRLGRNYGEIIEQWRIITKEKQADIKVLDMPLLDTTYAKDLLGTFVADLVLQVMSFVAEIERDNIRQRQAEGIAAAKAKGVKWGRERKELPEDFEEIYLRWAMGEITHKNMLKLCEMGKSAFYERVREYRENNPNF